MTTTGKLGGINYHDEAINYGGIPGAFGATTGYNIYSSDPMSDPNYQANRNMVAARIAEGLGTRPDTLQTGYSDQWRAKQLGLSDMLSAIANGTAGPSAAEMQLNQATDANNRAASSLAASSSQFGMDPAAAFKAALNQQAYNNQTAVGQASMLRANEAAAARGQLAGLYDSARNADMSQAQSELAAAVQQKQAMREYITQLMQMGYTEDQANYAAQLQQQQFQQGSLAQQEAAKHGVSTANSAQGVGFFGQVLGGASSGAAGGIAKAIAG